MKRYNFLFLAISLSAMHLSNLNASRKNEPSFNIAIKNLPALTATRSALNASQNYLNIFSRQNSSEKTTPTLIRPFEDSDSDATDSDGEKTSRLHHGGPVLTSLNKQNNSQHDKEGRRKKETPACCNRQSCSGDKNNGWVKALQHTSNPGSTKITYKNDLKLEDF